MIERFFKRFPPKKCALMTLGIFFMGFFVSFLIEVDLGTDPFSFMNLMGSRTAGISFGTFELIFNAVIFIPYFIWGRHLIGPGTVMNMVCIGYISDLCRFLWGKLIPREIFDVYPSRAIVFALAVLGFVIAAAVYMNADAGQSPYDGLAKVIADKLPKIPYFILRMLYDGTAVLIGCLLGGKLNPGLIAMVVLLGPAVSLVGKAFDRLAKGGGKDEA